MKRIILVLLLLACMMGTANAAYWEVKATHDRSEVSDFSVIFNDADLDKKVTADDIVSFSGVNITTSGVTRLYDEIYKLTQITINGLQLLSSESSHWIFHGSSYISYTEYGWTYSASETSAPTPIPGAAWLLGTGIMGLYGLRRKFL